MVKPALAGGGRFTSHRALIGFPAGPVAADLPAPCFHGLFALEGTQACIGV
jgi:hypothetical protein